MLDQIVEKFKYIFMVSDFNNLFCVESKRLVNYPAPRAQGVNREVYRKS